VASAAAKPGKITCPFPGPASGALARHAFDVSACKKRVILQNDSLFLKAIGVIVARTAPATGLPGAFNFRVIRIAL